MKVTQQLPLFRNHLEKFIALTDDEFEQFLSFFTFKKLRKNQVLIREGDAVQHTHWVTKGLLISTFTDANGKEHIIQFAPETWWLADGASLMTGKPSLYFVDAVEESVLLLIEPAAHQAIIERVPGYAVAFRTGLQKHNAAKDERIVTALSSSAEERYLEFLERYPSLAQRVPQWMLASYLGVSPETVSRIRKQLSRNQHKAR